MGETFQPNSFSGTGSFSIPINISKARGLEPHISLDYNSGTRNGIFGLGFELYSPKVFRKTDNGIPMYNDTDRFLFSNSDELIPKLIKKDDGNYIKCEKRVIVGDVTWSVISYIPRTEGLFASIEYWVNTNLYESYWKIVTTDNITSIYGQSENARIADPDDPTHVFEWLIENTFDAHGNKILYTYKREDGDSLQDKIYEKNRIVTANRYIQSIKYGNYPCNDGNNGNKEQYAFELIFDYGEYDLDNPDASPDRWDLRDDPFSSYRSGFEIRTLRLCKNILLFHHFEGEFENRPFLVRVAHIEYNKSPAVSLLTRVTEIGYRKDSSGKYETKQMPSVEFEYTSFNPQGYNFKPLASENGTTIPGYISGSQYMMIDLYGEGIPGFLHSNDVTTLYWEPQGNGTYGFPLLPDKFPLNRNMGNPENTLMDLDGNGRLDLLVKNPPCAGYYQVNHDGSWDQYKNFSSCPLDLFNPNIDMVDITGDGLNDILILEQESVKYYPSLGKNGFGTAVKVKRENEVPFNIPGYEKEVLTFADMFGDGRAHRIRIRDGLVECWPNLGYGRFGKKVILGNPPRFKGNFDARRLFLVDVDGSGTTDIAYVYQDRVEVFLNKSGNTFSEEPITILLPQVYDNLSQVTFSDVEGNGTSCLVLTTVHPDVSHLFCDIAGGVKPYLLKKINNNLGATTLIEYTSSIKFYLEDRKAGNPWITGLPYPVQVIEKIESIDHITCSKLVSTYKYHDGYFDPIEREFRGFGFVERWDTESFSDFSKPGLHKRAAFEANDESLHVPPVYTKSWYHTGADIQAGVISKHFEGEYYQGDTEVHLLPDSTFDPLIDQTDPETKRQAYVALKGHIIREEIYGLDGEETQKNPYTVVERNFIVRLDQPRDGQRFAVFYVYEQENIDYDYERNPQDPRVEHNLTLEVDQWGNVNKSCQIYYPRRIPGQVNDSEDPAVKIYSEQIQLKITAMDATFINVTEEFRLLGIPSETKNFEITGLDLEGKDYFTFEQAKVQVGDALKNQIPYEGDPEPGLKQARLLDWERYYYLNKNQDSQLELGSVTAQALLHHVENAKFTPELVTKVFGARLTVNTIEQKGGYVLKDGYWWNQGLTQVYCKEDQFYLPCETRDNLGGKTTVQYDTYLLSPIKLTQFITNEIENTIIASIDYQALHPFQITDINNNVSQVMFDPLGMVIVSTLFGMEKGKEIGGMTLYPVANKGAEYVKRVTTQTGEPISLEDVLTNPEYYLQGASSFFYYDLFAWKEQGQPACFINLLNEKFYNSEDTFEETGFQAMVSYSDGFGRALENKMKADPGKAISRDTAIKLVFDTSGKPEQAHTEDRWLVSGRTVYNNKGKPTLQFQPYFSSTPFYETQKEINDNDLVPPPVKIYYDPLLRVIKIESPKKKEADGSVTGFFSKVEFNSWMEKHYDENDTVKDSSSYQKHIEDTDPGFKNEKQALEKAAVFDNTPAIKILDNMARAFCAIDININEETGEKIYLPTHTKLDIEGKPLEMIDPRLARLDPPVPNFIHIFDMSGDLLYSNSVDAGINLSLNNMFGKHLWNLSPRNFCQLITYDTLQRTDSIRVMEITKDEPIESYDDFDLVEVYTYGETLPNAQDNNLRGQVYQIKDLSGVITNSQYSIQGQIQETSRQFAVNYKAINWNQDVALEDESYTTRLAYDAMSRLISKITPDSSVTVNSYNLIGRLYSVQVQYKDGTKQPVVEHIEYDAKNQRTEIKYGNQVITTYAYEETTLRLTGLKSTGIQEGEQKQAIQDIEYTYDPVGNITLIQDKTYETVFCNKQDVESVLDYTYDALYRLVKATGRQHPGITASTYKNNKKDGDFKQSKFGYLCSDNPDDQTHLEKYIETYTYDDSGNLVKKQHDAVSSSWSMETPPMEKSNRLKGYQYDDSGNLKQVNINNPVDLIYNCCENLVKAGTIKRPDEPNDCDYYNYDSNDIRTRKVLVQTESDGTVIQKQDIYLNNYTVKLVKKGQINNQDIILQRQTLRVMDDRTCVAIIDYWVSDDAKQETKESGTRKLRYQLNNHLGSVCLEVDSDAKLTSYEEYFPYGSTAIIAGNSQEEIKLKDYRYSGKERDDSTGFYYYGARYYAPWLGRWLKPDPAGIVDGLNLYAFVGGNPLSNVDVGGFSKRKGAPLTKGPTKKQRKESVTEIRKKILELHGSKLVLSKKIHQSTLYTGKTPVVVGPTKMSPERLLVRHLSTVLLSLDPKRVEVQAAISHKSRKIYIACNVGDTALGTYLKSVKTLKDFSDIDPSKLDSKRYKERVDRHLSRLMKEKTGPYKDYVIEHVSGLSTQHAETKIREKYSDFDYIGGTRRPCLACTLHFQSKNVDPKTYNPHPGGFWDSEAGLLSLHGADIKDTTYEGKFYQTSGVPKLKVHDVDSDSEPEI